MSEEPNDIESIDSRDLAVLKGLDGLLGTSVLGLLKPLLFKPSDLDGLLEAPALDELLAIPESLFAERELELPEIDEGSVEEDKGTD